MWPGTAGTQPTTGYLYDDRHVLASADDVDRVQGAFADPGNQEQFFEGEGTVLNADDDVRGATISEIVRIVPPVSRPPKGTRRAGSHPGRQPFPRMSRASSVPTTYLHVTAGGDGRVLPGDRAGGDRTQGPMARGETKATEAGKGVRIAVIDTGWLQVVADYPTKWLARGVSGEPEPERPALREYAGHGTFIAGVLRCRAPKADIDHLRPMRDGGAVSGVRPGRQARRGARRERDPHTSSTSRRAATRGATSTSRASSSCGGRAGDSRTPPTPCWWPQPGTTGLRRPLLPRSVRLGVRRRISRPGRQRVDRSPTMGESADVFVLGRNHVNAYPKGKYVCKEAPNKGDERFFGRGLARWSGTSFATPLVAGILAARFDPAGGRTVRDVALELVQNADVENDPSCTATTASSASSPTAGSSAPERRNAAIPQT